MATSKQYTLTLNPDPNCEKLDINWIGFPGLLVSCINNNIVTFELDPNSPEQCIEAIITCLDKEGNISCNSCEPVHFRKCFCVKDTDCGDCAKCSENGTCSDTCTQEELASGKLCYEDGCNCPPTKPYDHPTLGCVECLEGQVHPSGNSCLICKDGKWITKPCPEGVCDETTGDCIPDCSKNTDGRTKYNPTTGQCDCERGYIWSTIKERCVLDEDCKLGFERNPITGDCEPIECPPGYEYDIEKDDCVKIDNCKNTPCENGLDCEEGCGCSKTPGKGCVNCEEEPDAYGCQDNCGKESCDDNNPCTGENCTCVDGICVGCDNFPCGICGNISGCQCTDGINCEAQPDPECQDKEELKIENCSLISTLELKSKCSCIAIGNSTKVIKLVEIDAGDNKVEHKVQFELDLRKKWNNNQIGYENEDRFIKSTILLNNDFPDSANYNLNIRAVYLDWEGEQFENSLPVVSGQIFSGEGANKTTSTITPEISLGYSNIDFGTENTSKLIGYRIIIKVGDVNFIEKNCMYPQEIVYSTTGFEEINPITNSFYLHISRLRSTSTRNPLLTVKRFNSLTPNGEIIRSVYKLPVSQGKYEDVFWGSKQLNLLERGQQNLLEQEFEGELIPLNEYQASWDCGCDDTKTITLEECDKSLQDWKIEEHFKIETRVTGDPGQELPDLSSVGGGAPIQGETCNNTLIGNNSLDVCSFNQDLSLWNYSEEIINKYQTKYIVKVNLASGNSEIATTLLHNGIRFVIAEDTSQSWQGFTKTFNSRIVSVSIEQNHDSTCMAQDNVPFNLEADVISVCSGSEPIVRVSEISSQIQSVKINNSSISHMWASNDSFEEYGKSHGIKNKVVNVIDVTFVGGCVKRYETSVDCCLEDSALVSITQEFSKTGFVGTFKTNLNQPIKSIIFNGVNYQFEPEYNSIEKLSISINNTTYSGTIITADGCELPFSGGTVIDDSIENEFTLNPSVICENDEVVYSLNTNSPNTSFTINTPTGNINGQTDINGNYTNVISNTSLQNQGDYILSQFGVLSPNIIRSLVVESQPVVQGISLIGMVQTQYCENQDIQIQVTGTPGSAIILDLGDGRQETVNILNGQTTAFITISYSTQGNYIVKAISTSNSSCSSTVEGIELNVNIIPGISLVSITDNCVGVVEDGNIDLTVQVNNATSVQIFNNATNVLLGTLTDVGGFNFNGILQNSSSTEIKIIATNGTNNCNLEEIYVTKDCLCDFISPPVVPDNQYICGANTVDMVVASLPNTVVEWYNGVDTSGTPDYTGESVSLSSVGPYRVRYRNLLTNCTSNFTAFEILEGNIHSINISLSPNSNMSPVVGESITLIANTVVTNPPGQLDMLYSWLVSTDGGITFTPVSSNMTSNTLSYQILTNGTFIFKVIAQRGTSACVNEDTYSITTQVVCDPKTIPQILTTSNMNGPCGDPVITTNGFEDNIEWKINNAVVGTGLSVPSTVFEGGNQSVNYTVTLYKDNCPDQVSNFIYTNNVCQDANYVFILDTSGSISGTEPLSIATELTDIIAGVSSASPTSTFTVLLLEYSSSDGFQEYTGAMTPTAIANAVNNSIGNKIVTAAPNISNYILNGVGSNSKPIKYIYYTDEVVGYSTTDLALVNLNWFSQPLPATCLGSQLAYTPVDVNTSIGPINDYLKTPGSALYVRKYFQNWPNNNFTLCGVAPGDYNLDIEAQKILREYIASSPNNYFEGDFSNLQQTILNNLGCNC